jgi:hypothetical protein
MDIPSFIIMGIIGLVGVAAGYGALKSKASRNERDIEEVKETLGDMDGKFVPQTECALRHDQLVKKLETVQTTVVDQQRTTQRLLNFAMHQLTSNGMSLADAQDVLENGRN